MCATNFCSLDWFRNTACSTGVYNVCNDNHFYSGGPNYWHINSKSGCTHGGLIFYSQHNGSQENATGRRGYIYWDGTANFGLLSCGGSWRVQVVGDTDIRLCNTTCVYGTLTGNGEIRSNTNCTTGSGWATRTAGCIYAGGCIRGQVGVCSNTYVKADTYMCAVTCVCSPVVCATSCIMVGTAKICEQIGFTTIDSTEGLLVRDNSANIMEIRNSRVCATRAICSTCCIYGEQLVFSPQWVCSGGNICGGNTIYAYCMQKGAGSFAIPHPDPAKKTTHVLRHSFVESPTAGDNIYRWQVETSNCMDVITLPDYYRRLNKDDMVWVSPYKHFGSAYGEVTADQC
ncbi:MAG: hypothetical protein VX237_07105, partial [Chloroflexota bacterium]|nr:hypothetical protein [Chloroflexota bacterium]